MNKISIIVAEKLSFLICFASVLFLSSCHQEGTFEEIKVDDGDQALWEKASIYLKPIQSKDLSTVSEEHQVMIGLGKRLFFDENLSLNRNQSCNTCHDLKAYGVDNEIFSKGSNEELGTRNTPSVFNACEQYAQFWDGRADDLKIQAKGSLLNEKEMAMSTPEFVVNRVAENPEYIYSFETCFSDSTPTITLENIVAAMAAFEDELITPSRFDDYLNGDLGALSEIEKKGLNLFIDSGCIPCHGGSTVGGKLWQPFPLYGRVEDYALVVSSDSVDAEGKMLFKIPSLRNVEKTEPYFHNGSVETLAEAVDIMAKAQTNNFLSEEEVDDIIAFLKSLTGRIPEIAK